MKKLIFIFLLITTSQFILAQNDLKARIEFEEAEKQFDNNNFLEALLYLEKTETLIGKWTPKVSFMKIESLQKIADLSDLETVNSIKLVKEVGYYMDYCEKQKDNVIMEKFKVVYAIDKSIKEQMSKQVLKKRMPEYIEGINAYVERNYRGAMECYLRAADKGDGDSMSAIALLYVNGEGVAQDYSKAMEWYLKSVETGNQGYKSQNAIGLLYYNGQGVKKDYVKAKEWFDKGYLEGDVDSIKMLIKIYNDGGYGVIRDIDRATRLEKLYGF